jgi:phosphate-selective porin OprO/OprP
MRSLRKASSAFALALLSVSAASAESPLYRLAPVDPLMEQAAPIEDGYYEPLDAGAPISFEAPAAPSVEDRLKALEKQIAAPPKPPTTFPNVKINGVFQVDGGVYHQDTASVATFGHLQNGVDFRRARLAASGNVSEQISYFMQFDFGAPGRPTFTDVWMQANEVPVFGNIRVGQWKQPFSLEVVSSFRYTTFMERSVVFQPFTPFRHIGIGFFNWSDDLNTTWAASAIRTGQDQFGGSVSTDGGNGLVARGTHLLHWDEASDGRSYVHAGAGYFFNAPPNDLTRFRTIPEFFVGEQTQVFNAPNLQPVPGNYGLFSTPFFVDTGVLAVENVQTFGAEFLWVQGPMSLQSEAVVAVVDRPGALSTVTLPGGYLQVGYFLTGEHRPYDRKAGAIDRIKPFEDFFWVQTCEGHGDYGMGAWEVAGRISYIDLNDDAVRGGQMTDVTAGVNWYLNPYTKIVGNYIHSFVDNPTVGNSGTDIFAMRAQIDF